MKLETTRFGVIDLDEQLIIDMKGPILGFERLRRYILLKRDEKTPFNWFQSIDDGSVAFIVMNPQAIKPDYEPEIEDFDVELLEIERAEDVVLMSIITIRSNPTQVSANLRAPIVINSRKRLAKQIVLEDPDHSIQYEIPIGKSAPQKDCGKDCERDCGAAR